MRWLALLAVLSLVACDGETSSGGPGEAGGGGTDAPGGTGGSGGTGGGDPADGLAPVLVVVEPGTGTSFVQPNVTVRGTVSDDTGVERLWWIDPAGDRWDLPADGSREGSFEFVVHLAEGENVLTVGAEDAAGNRAALELTLHLSNPPGLRPTIELFEADRDWVEEDGSVELRWTVTGTRPIRLVIRSTTSNPAVVTDAASARLGVGNGDDAVFELAAVNDFGEAADWVQVGVGAALRIWPREATIVPGARQALVTENAAYHVTTTWTASGGEVQPGSSVFGTSTWFRSAMPGVYTLTATTDEREPRTATARITIAEHSSTMRGFHGVGGQFGAVNGWDRNALAVDGHGNVWVAPPGWGGGLAVWRPADHAWTFEGDAGWSGVSEVFSLHFGELVAFGSTTVRRLDAGADAWATVSEGLPAELDGAELAVGPDGTVYAMKTSWGEPPSLLVLSPGASAPIALSLPAGIEPRALAFGPGGALFLAGKSEAELTSVFCRDAGGWADLGPVPAPDEEIRDLLVGADGALYLAGRSLARFADGAWATIGSFPTCAANELCGLFDLAVRSDGALLVVERSELYVGQGDGTFVVVGASIGPMHTGNRILGTLRQVAEAADGTLYLRGDLGVYGLPPGGGTWSVLGEPGIMPASDTGDLLVEPDGSWTLAAGGWGGQDGHFSLYTRAADGGAWTGFGNWAGNIYDAEPITHLARDGAGNLYGFAMAPWAFVFRIAADTGEVEPLPYDNRIRALESWSSHAFGVARDGTVYVSGRTGSEWHVYRLRPGATEWAVEFALEEPTDFARTADGALWVLDGWPRVLAPGSSAWHDVWEGLPSSFRCVDLAAVDDGSLLLATENGVFRLAPGTATWRRLGYGEPSLGAVRLASRGGRTWALGETVYELDTELETWVPYDGWLPVTTHLVTIFDAAADGSLLIAEPEKLGLLRSFDGP